MTGLDDLTRSDFRRAAERAGDSNGEFGERLTAAAYGIRHVPDEADWYDCRHQSRGTKYEVKTAQTVIDGEDESTFVATAGRIRVWMGQTRSLINSASTDGQSAWFVFVLLDGDGEPVAMRRVAPSTVWSWVTDDLGGWDDSGHDNPDRNQQQKLPLDKVFDL